MRTRSYHSALNANKKRDHEVLSPLPTHKRKKAAAERPIVKSIPSLASIFEYEDLMKEAREAEDAAEVASVPTQVLTQYPRKSSTVVCARRVPQVKSNPLNSAWTLTHGKYCAEDKVELEYVPYFGDDNREDVVSDVYEVQKRQKELDSGPLWLRYAGADDLPAPPAAAPPAPSAALPPAPSAAAPSRSEGRSPRPQALQYRKESESARLLLCRRCFTYDCRAHEARGPAREAPDAAETVEDHARAVFGGDAEVAKCVLRADNRRRRRIFCGDCVEEPAASAAPAAVAVAPSAKLSYRKHQRKPNEVIPAFVPCQCRGGDCAKGCPCDKELNNFCTVECGCDPLLCTNRFPGCTCTSKCNTMNCPCYAAGFECSPDTCTNCGACSAQPHSCTNDAISLRRTKHLLLARSTLPSAGWGLFAKDDIRKGEFIQEYTGEEISQEEAERRGRVYDKLNRSYLFNLNNEAVVDAARKGNKTRFANHSRRPNCHMRVMVVKGDHRIGMYASSDIPAQTELLFDYRYDTDEVGKDGVCVKKGVRVDWMVESNMAGEVSKWGGGRGEPGKKLKGH